MRLIPSCIMRALAPDPYLSIDEWADNFRVLPQGASAEAGPYRTERMPYLREIMYELSPQSATQQVKVIKGTQLGLTEVGNNVAMYYMDIVPASQLMLLPTETLAKDHSNRKLTPSLRAMPNLAKRITGGKTRDDIGGTFEKGYPGGMLKIAWAGSPANFRSMSCRVVILDDIDGYPRDADGEGDPIDLGRKRADAFGSQKKIYINSTPTVAGSSAIELEFENSDQRHYHVPCPECGELFAFEKDRFVFDYDETTYRLTSDVKCACQSCGTLIDEHEKTSMMLRGEWVPYNPGNEHRGYRIPSYYSPVGFLSWNEIFSEFLAAKKAMSRGDLRKMKTWVNTRDANPWEEELDRVEIEDTSKRVEKYNAEVPDGVYLITAGVDTQDDRFEIEVVGWGKDGESWSIDYRVIPHDPQTPEARAALDEYLMRDYLRADGSTMRIYATGVDTGGHRTDAAYSYCKARAARRVFALKGANVIAAPITNGTFSRRNKKKVPLFSIGVNTAKDDIYAKLEITEPGPGYMHFPDKPAYDDRYFKMLTAEKRDAKGRWVKYRARNEAIDCRVYALAALHICGIDIDKMQRPYVIAGTSAPTGQQQPQRRTRRRIISRGRRT